MYLHSQIIGEGFFSKIFMTFGVKKDLFRPALNWCVVWCH